MNTGLHIPRGVYPEETREDGYLDDIQTCWPSAAQVGRPEGMQDSRRLPETGSCAPMHQHFTEVCGIVHSGIKGKECNINSKAIQGTRQEFHGREFLDERLHCIKVGLDEEMVRAHIRH